MEVPETSIYEPLKWYIASMLGATGTLHRIIARNKREAQKRYEKMYSADVVVSRGTDLTGYRYMTPKIAVFEVE